MAETWSGEVHRVKCKEKRQADGEVKVPLSFTFTSPSACTLLLALHAVELAAPGLRHDGLLGVVELVVGGELGRGPAGGRSSATATHTTAGGRRLHAGAGVRRCLFTLSRAHGSPVSPLSRPHRSDAVRLISHPAPYPGGAG